MKYIQSFKDIAFTIFPSFRGNILDHQIMSCQASFFGNLVGGSKPPSQK